LAEWTFITNHGAVLTLINRHEKITTREIAGRLSITERSVIRIIKDLEKAGYICKQRIGRSNQYTINHETKLRSRSVRDIAVGDLLLVLSPQ
jgi:predicted transcriptional regulator